MSILRIFILIALALKTTTVSAAIKTYTQPISSQHVYQKNYSKLGLAGYVYCGPSAVTESLAFLKWHRTPSFPLLKWHDDLETPNQEADDYLYSQTRDMAELLKTSIFAMPGMEQYFTDPAEIVKGLRKYFKNSGYPSPWVYARGFRAFDAPEGVSLEEMRKSVTLEDVREHVRKGYGVILLVGYYYAVWSQRKHRFGGHFVAVFGYEYDTAWSDSQSDFFITDSLFTSDQQPRKIRFRPIERKDKLIYPDHVSYQLDGDNSAYLDTAIFFIPQVQD